jgi:hypothetical protein
LGRKRRDKEESGRLVDEVNDSEGPATLNNRVKKVLRKIRKR